MDKYERLRLQANSSIVDNLFEKLKASRQAEPLLVQLFLNELLSTVDQFTLPDKVRDRRAEFQQILEELGPLPQTIPTTTSRQVQLLVNQVEQKFAALREQYNAARQSAQVLVAPVRAPVQPKAPKPSLSAPPPPQKVVGPTLRPAAPVPPTALPKPSWWRDGINFDLFQEELRKVNEFRNVLLNNLVFNYLASNVNYFVSPEVTSTIAQSFRTQANNMERQRAQQVETRQDREIAKSLYDTFVEQMNQILRINPRPISLAFVQSDQVRHDIPVPKPQPAKAPSIGSPAVQISQAAPAIQAVSVAGCPPLAARISLKPHQLQVLELLFRPTVHGVVAVHGLGTGKTLTAVAASDCFLRKNPDGYVVVVSPAQLRDSFLREKRCKFDPSYRVGESDDLLSHYFFTTFDGLTALEVLLRCYNKQTAPLMLIVDEAHNLRTKVEEAKIGTKDIPQTVVDFVQRILRSPEYKERKLQDRFWAVTSSSQQQQFERTSDPRTTFESILSKVRAKVPQKESLSPQEIALEIAAVQNSGSSNVITQRQYEENLPNPNVVDTLKQQAKQFLDLALVTKGVKASAVRACGVFASKVLLLTGTPVYDVPGDLSVLVEMSDPSAPVLEPDEVAQLSLPENREIFDKYIHDSYGDPIFHFYSPAEEELRQFFPRVKYETVEINVDALPGEYLQRFENEEREIRRQSKNKEFASTQPVVFSRPQVQGTSSSPEGSEPAIVEVNYSNAFLNRFRTAINTLEESAAKPYAPKMYQMLKLIKDAKKQSSLKADGMGQSKYRTVVNFYHLDSGLLLLKKLIDEENRRLPAEDRISYAIVQGKTPSRESDEAIRKYNNDELDVLLVSSAFTEGINLFGTRLLIMGEPVWSPGEEAQTVGRVVRYKSHNDLANEDRVVKVVRVITKRSDEKKRAYQVLKNSQPSERWVSSVEDEPYVSLPVTAEERMMQLLEKKKDINTRLVDEMWRFSSLRTSGYIVGSEICQYLYSTSPQRPSPGREPALDPRYFTINRKTDANAQQVARALLAGRYVKTQPWAGRSSLESWLRTYRQQKQQALLQSRRGVPSAST